MKNKKQVLAESGVLIFSIAETLCSFGSCILFFFVGNRVYNSYNLCTAKRPKKIKSIK